MQGLAIKGEMMSIELEVNRLEASRKIWRTVGLICGFLSLAIPVLFIVEINSVGVGRSALSFLGLVFIALLLFLMGLVGMAVALDRKSQIRRLTQAGYEPPR